MSTKAKAKVPKDQPPKRDPNLRRIPINKLQAKTLGTLHAQLEQATKADEGTIRAQSVLNSYASAIVHGDGESRPAKIIGVEPTTGSKHVLVVKVQKGQ